MDVEKYTEELGEIVPTDEEFFDNRIANFIASTPNNFEQNNEKADQLKIAGYFLFVSFIFIGLFIISIIIIK